jgi:type II secretory pathway pseudopilin PulG
MPAALRTDENNMNCQSTFKNHRWGRRAAFSLVEAMIGTMIIGVLFVAMYTGISASFGIIIAARENLRATQIMLDRMEEFRVYKYTWVTNSSNFPSNWSEPYFPSSTNYAASDINTGSNINSNTGGFLYYGTLSVTPITTFTDVTYGSSLYLVTVTLNWTNGAVRTRTMSTIYSQYGMQSYLYN